LIMELLLLCLFAGIGVDDMFVIVQAWSNLSPKEHETQPISERMGLTLQHAVSYLIVSLAVATLIFIANDHDHFNQRLTSRCPTGAPQSVKEGIMSCVGDS